MYTNSEVGCRTIAEELNRLGIQTINKKKWSEIGIKHILTNPVYMGKIRWKHFKTIRVMQDGKIVKKRKHSEEFELYDASYLKDLPEVHKTGFTVKKTRQEAISLFSCLDAFLTEEPLGPDDMW